MIRRIDLRTALPWVLDSLTQGSLLSAGMRPHAEQMRYATLLGSPDVVPPKLDDASRGLSSRESSTDLVTFLEAARLRGGRTVLVENDMARRGDPHLPPDAGFIGDRVLEWAEITPDARSAARLLRDASTSFPLNAFIACRPLHDIDTLRARQLDSLIPLLCADVVGIIVAAFDGESFVALTREDIAAFGITGVVESSPARRDHNE